MGLRSIGVLASQRRAAPPGQPQRGVVAGGPTKGSHAHDGSATALEAAVPTEVITLYTAIIAGTTAVEQTGSYLPFRVMTYAIGVVATAVTTIGAVRMNTESESRSDAFRSAEFWTANLAFVAWGMVLPGSFLYAWLTGSALSLTVITITATTTFVLTVSAGPKLRQKVRQPASGQGDPPP